MDIPHRGQRPSLSLPEIYVHESHPNERYHRASSRSSPYNSASSPGPSSVPMSIPNAREPVPPPLPPPKNTAALTGQHDIAWQWGNSPEGEGWGRAASSIPPGSSLYGSFAARGNSMVDEHPDPRRGSSVSTIKSISGVDTRDNYPRIDEGYASLSGTSIGLVRLLSSSLFLSLSLCVSLPPSLSLSAEEHWQLVGKILAPDAMMEYMCRLDQWTRSLQVWHSLRPIRHSLLWPLDLELNSVQETSSVLLLTVSISQVEDA